MVFSADIPCWGMLGGAGHCGESREIWTSAFINIPTDVGMMLVEVLLLGLVCCLLPSVHFAARVYCETRFRLLFCLSLSHKSIFFIRL